MRKSIGALANLPKELDFLVEPALQYGRYYDDSKRARFLKGAGEAVLEELAAIAERYRLAEEHDRVAEFFDAYPITEYTESANLYWLFALMDEAGLLLSPQRPKTVQDYIESLGRHGSFRLASERALAARFLADYGRQAKPAIPALQRAVEDEDLRVQVWAHYALAVLENDHMRHEAAIQQILLQHDAKDEWGEYVEEIAENALAALEKLSNLPGRKDP